MLHGIKVTQFRCKTNTSISYSDWALKLSMLLTLHRIAGKQALGIAGARQLTQQDVALDLQIELVACELLLQATGIAYKELE